MRPSFVDPKLVVDYVTEAVSKFDEFKARERALEERGRGAPPPGVDQTS